MRLVMLPLYCFRAASHVRISPWQRSGCAGVVAELTATHDAQLIRLYAYLDSAGPVALRSEPSPDDIVDVQLVMWSDAGWAGDPEDTKSTFGFVLEFENPNNGRRWPISWAVRRQRSTTNSTAEASTVDPS